MIRRLIKIWLGVLGASVVCTWAVIAVLTLNQDPYPPEVDVQRMSESYREYYDNIHRSHSGILAVMMTYVVLVLSAGTTTMFFNVAERVRKNTLLRFLSFFLVPVAFIAIVCHEGITVEGLLTFIPLFAPFFVCLTMAYVWFSRKLKPLTA